MGFLQDMNEQNGEVTTEAKVPEKKGTDVNKKAITEEFKLQGESIRNSYTQDQKDAEGSKRDTVTLKGVVYDPSQKQSIKEGGVSKPGNVVIGYTLEFSEDRDIPVAPYTVNADKTNKLEVAYPETTRHVTAGSVEYLNVYETARLIAYPEFAGKFTGGGVEAYLRPAGSKNRDYPLPIICSTGKGSIKNNSVEAAEKIDGKWVCKEEFKASFGNWFAKNSITKPQKTEKTDSAAVLAAAFNAYFDKRNREGASKAQ